MDKKLSFILILFIFVSCINNNTDFNLLALSNKIASYIIQSVEINNIGKEGFSGFVNDNTDYLLDNILDNNVLNYKIYDEMNFFNLKSTIYLKLKSISNFDEKEIENFKSIIVSISKLLELDNSYDIITISNIVFISKISPINLYDFLQKLMSNIKHINYDKNELTNLLVTISQSKYVNNENIFYIIDNLNKISKIISYKTLDEIKKILYTFCYSGIKIDVLKSTLEDFLSVCKKVDINYDNATKIIFINFIGKLYEVYNQDMDRIRKAHKILLYNIIKLLNNKNVNLSIIDYGFIAWMLRKLEDIPPELSEDQFVNRLRGILGRMAETLGILDDEKQISDENLILDYNDDTNNDDVNDDMDWESLKQGNQ